MRVLVTGGSGIIEAAAIAALTQKGHTARLVRGQEVTGSCDGCDAILHVAETQFEEPPDTDFETINVHGTRRALEEATRRGVKRFVLVSSLGAQAGATDYHRSKRRAEDLVRSWEGAWTICRVGPVYGPGDRVASMLLRAVRMMPALPVVDGIEVQPVWASDLGEALVRVVERSELSHKTLELAGPEALTLRELFERLSAATGKQPRLVSVPGWLAEMGLDAVQSLGLPVPADENFMTTLMQNASIPKGRSNALVGELGVKATTIDDGLMRLVNEMPESTPREGAGPLWRGRYRADITGGEFTTDGLFEAVCANFNALLHDGNGRVVRKGLAEGQVLSVPLPLRGDVQLRVEEIEGHRISCVTLEHQPFSGAVRILVEPRGPMVRFEIQTYERASNMAELLALAAGGAALKRSTWVRMVERVIELSRGQAPAGIEMDEEALPEDQVDDVEAWIGRLVAARPRAGSVPVPGMKPPKRGYGSRVRK